MRNLIEGLRRNDLEDTIIPLLSVDEYESKISKTAIVIAFFSNDLDAANDLNRFIQKSPYGVIDSEVSNTMDKSGYYLIFAELYNDIKIASNIQNILKDLKNVANITDWNVKIKGKKVSEFDLNSLSEYFNDIRESSSKHKNSGNLFSEFN